MGPAAPCPADPRMASPTSVTTGTRTIQALPRISPALLNRRASRHGSGAAIVYGRTACVIAVLTIEAPAATRHAAL